MRNKAIKSISVSVLILLLSTGCQKFIKIDPPVTQLVTASVFESDQTAVSAMNGIYSLLISSGGFADGSNRSVGYLCGLSADELTNYSTDPESIQFYQNSLATNNFFISTSLWTIPYQCIYDVNALLEGINQSVSISQNTKRELAGEAKFVRAFCNFYLTGLFGPIPVIKTTDYRINANASRQSQDSVYQLIINDLLDAKLNLPTDYSTSGGERVRPNVWAASALLARVYLFSGRWVEAEAESSLVIGEHGLFELPADLNEVFLKNSREAIWQLMPNLPEMNTQEGNMYILDTDPTNATLSPQFLASFEDGDLRKAHWVGEITIGLNEYFYPYKYKVKYSDVLTEYSMVLRLAEQYLIRAEARARQVNLEGATEDLNKIRNRAGLSSLVVTDQTTILTEILHERQVELFSEWGHRWMDLVRTRQADSVLSGIKNNWSSADILYPIPAEEIQKDANLTQNPGY